MVVAPETLENCPRPEIEVPPKVMLMALAGLAIRPIVAAPIAAIVSLRVLAVIVFLLRKIRFWGLKTGFLSKLRALETKVIVETRFLRFWLGGDLLLVKSGRAPLSSQFKELPVLPLLLQKNYHQHS